MVFCGIATGNFAWYNQTILQNPWGGPRMQPLKLAVLSTSRIVDEFCSICPKCRKFRCRRCAAARKVKKRPGPGPRSTAFPPCIPTKMPAIRPAGLMPSTSAPPTTCTTVPPNGPCRQAITSSLKSPSPAQRPRPGTCTPWPMRKASCCWKPSPSFTCRSLPFAAGTGQDRPGARCHVQLLRPQPPV